MYGVFYLDDNNRTHYCVANNEAELYFVQERFCVTRYEIIPFVSK